MALYQIKDKVHKNILVPSKSMWITALLKENIKLWNKQWDWTLQIPSLHSWSDQYLRAYFELGAFSSSTGVSVEVMTESVCAGSGSVLAGHPSIIGTSSGPFVWSEQMLFTTGFGTIESLTATTISSLGWCYIRNSTIFGRYTREITLYSTEPAFVCLMWELTP